MKTDKISHPERFDLRNCGKINCPEHTNFGIEVAIVKTGILSMRIENEEYTLRETEAVIVYPYETHDYRGDSKMTFLSVLLNGDSSDLFFRFTDYRRTKKRVFTVPETVIEYLDFLEHTAKTEGYERDDTLIMSVIAPILYCLRGQLLLTGERTYQSAFLQAVNYIDAHYTDEIKLTEAAKAIGTNPSYLSRTFAQNAEMGFTAYVNTRRVIYAAHLLHNTEDTVAVIAEKSGFGTVRTFNRAFERHFGQTPGQYRKQQTEGTQ